MSAARQQRPGAPRRNPITPFVGNIEEMTLNNNHFREVLATLRNMQLVLMSIPPNDEVGSEVHPTIDQFVRIESGRGVFDIDGMISPATDGMIAFIPAGTRHNIVNTSSSTPLQLYTIYSPPEHPPGLRQMYNPRRVENYGAPR